MNAVGLTSHPDEYEQMPRRFSPWKRLFAGILLLFFFAATVVTGAVTLGEYCLTSDGANTRVLHESLQLWNGGQTPIDRSP